jgi:hypothetical protein
MVSISPRRLTASRAAGFGDLFGLFQRCAFGDGPLGGFVSCIAGGLARARVHDVLRDCPS